MDMLDTHLNLLPLEPVASAGDGGDGLVAAGGWGDGPGGGALLRTRPADDFRVFVGGGRDFGRRCRCSLGSGLRGMCCG